MTMTMKDFLRHSMAVEDDKATIPAFTYGSDEPMEEGELIFDAWRCEQLRQALNAMENKEIGSFRIGKVIVRLAREQKWNRDSFKARYGIHE